jgi:transposase
MKENCMPMRRKPMKRVREIFRLYEECNLSRRSISKALNISRPVVSDYLNKYQRSGLKYEEIKYLDDNVLLERLNNDTGRKSEKFEQLSANFPYFSKELLRTGVNLKTLWDEYKAIYPEGYGYSQFCYHYQEWNQSLEMSMHIEHKAGDKMFVDFTGKKLSITDRITGEQREVETFVAVLGASQYTYVEAVENQKKENFIKANENAIHYIGGAPKAIVPDCLKSGVTKGDKYEPDINPDYADFARHYGLTILPARPYSPKDKALVEGAVKIVYSWIYAAIRNRVFYSIEELNESIREILEKYNSKKMQRLSFSRKELFIQSEKSELKPLPIDRYEAKKFARIKVQFNYHVYLSEDGHYYSVPFIHRGKRADIIYTGRNVEIFLDNIRIAFHKRDYRRGGYTTEKEHMPASHKWMDNWNPEKLQEWGMRIGESVGRIIQTVLKVKEHPEQGYRICLGILSLEKAYGKERLNKACQRALHFGLYSYKGIKNILERGLENYDTEQPSLFSSIPKHENIRGNEYYY